MNGSERHYWDSVAGEWYRTRPQCLWRAHSDAVNILLLAQWLPARQVDRLLKTDLFDEAWSSGLYPQLSPRAKNIFGTDVSTLAPRAARLRYRDLRTLCADVRRLPFADGVFDLLISNSTLDHFETPDEIITSLGELHRVLRPGGELLLTLDNRANPLIALRNLLPFPLLHRLGILPYYVGATFGPRRLKNVLRRMNFEILEMKAVMHFPRVLGVALARLLEQHAPAEIQKRFLRLFLSFESFSKLPTRYLTGHYIATRVRKHS